MRRSVSPAQASKLQKYREVRRLRSLGRDEDGRVDVSVPRTDASCSPGSYSHTTSPVPSFQPVTRDPPRPEHPQASWDTPLASDVSGLQRENRRLSDRVAALEQERMTLLRQLRESPDRWGDPAEAVAREKAAYQEEVLAKVDSMIKAYRVKAEEEIERYRIAECKARERLGGLQRAIQSERVDSLAPHSVLANDLSDPATRKLIDGLAESFLDNLLAQGASDPAEAATQDPEEVAKNVQQAVEKSCANIVRHYHNEVQGLVDEHSAVVARLQKEQKRLMSENAKLRAKLAACVDGTPPRNGSPSGRELFPAGLDEDAAAMVREAKKETQFAKEEVDQERQRVALVCIRMKGALQKKNAEFEEAVMKKADELVAHYKHSSEIAQSEAERLQQQALADQEKLRELQCRPATASAGTQCPDADMVAASSSPMSSAPTLPQQTFVQAITSQLKRRGEPTPAPPHTVPDDTVRFERDVFAKAQVLLRKYSSSVLRDRELDSALDTQRHAPRTPVLGNVSDLTSLRSENPSPASSTTPRLRAVRSSGDEGLEAP